MKYMLIGVTALFLMCISLSSVSMRVRSESYLNQAGEKMLRCTYFTGYGLIKREYNSVRDNVYTCNFILRASKR